MVNSTELSDTITWMILTPFIILLVVFIWVSLRSLKVVERWTAMVVERLGKFKETRTAGLVYLIPFIERPRYITWRTSETVLGSSSSWTRHRSNDFIDNMYSVNVKQERIDRIDLREQVMDLPVQKIITRDNVSIGIHPMVLFKLIDPVRVAYQTFDLAHAVEKIVQTTLRSIIGDMGLDDTLASREEINRGLQHRISNVCLNWGLEIIKAEILEIIPGDDIQEAMHKQIKAERIRRAKIIEADGYREQLKTKAEGEAQAVISVSKGEQQQTVIIAKGRADAKLIIARAEAEALGLVAAALKEFKIEPTNYMIGLKYIDSFKDVLARASSRRMLLPFESDVIGALSEVGA